jgi:hypothetical protein
MFKNITSFYLIESRNLSEVTLVSLVSWFFRGSSDFRLEVPSHESRFRSLISVSRGMGRGGTYSPSGGRPCALQEAMPAALALRHRLKSRYMTHTET